MVELNPRKRSLIWKGLSLLGGVGLLAVVIFGLAIGSCHSQGGFCSGEFDQGNRDAFYSALVASVGVGPLLLVPFARKIPWLIAAALAGFGLTLALVMSLWP